MEDRLLDRMLDESAPRTAGTVSDDTLLELVREHSRRSRMRVRPVVVLSTVGVLALAGATAAAAAPGLLTHLGWMSENSTAQVISTGDVCDQGYRVLPEVGVLADDPTVLAARRILVDLDLDSIDITDEIAYLDEELKNAIWTSPGEPMTYTRSGIESWAQYIAVNDEVRQTLTEQGFDPARMEVGGATECGKAQIE